MSTDSQNIYNRNLAADFTNHNVLAKAEDIPWLDTLAPTSTLESDDLGVLIDYTYPSKEIIDQATKTLENDESCGWFDDGCNETPNDEDLYRQTVPVYAVHGQEGLGGGSSKFELTWADLGAENDCTAPAKKSELFVNMGIEELPDGLGNRDATSLFFWDAALNQNRAYYMAVPNERYLLLIQHFIYKFPFFLRDENGNAVDEKDIDKPRSSYSDIRDFPFEDLPKDSHGRMKWNPGNNRGADSIHAYVPGCACGTSDVTGPADGSHTDISAEAKPYADINLAYTNAIVPGSEKTMKYTITHEDLAQMTYCACYDEKNYVYNFEGINPETRFGTEEFFTSILQRQGVDLSDYITEGQYAVFYVGFSPERHGDDADCHDQVGFRYAFAFNLKDRPVKQNPSPCQADPSFVAKFDDVHSYGRSCTSFSFPESQEDFGYNTAPKLYDVPQEIIDKYFVDLMPGIDPKSFMEVQYPGKIYMQYDTQGNDIKDKNVTDCLYLAGRRIDPCGTYINEEKSNLTYYFKPEQPMLGIKTSTNKRMIGNNDEEWRDITTPYYTQQECLADSPQNLDNTYGLSVNTSTLAQSDCVNAIPGEEGKRYNEVVSYQYAGQDSEDSDNCRDGYCYEYNVHLNLNFDVHTKIAINNTSTFGTYCEGREGFPFDDCNRQSRGNDYSPS